MTLTREGIDYFEEPDAQPNSVQFNFHAPVDGSIIGSQQNATLNYGSTLKDIDEFIAGLSEEDQKELNGLSDELSKLSESQEPIKKGGLAKFSNAVQKHTPLLTAIGSWITQILLANPQ